MSEMNRKFGWLPNIPDHDDEPYALHSEMLGSLVLPPLVDLRKDMSPIEDQGRLGSCVAHATVAVLEFLELQGLKKKDDNAKEVFPDNQFDDISRLFVYYNARALDGNTNRDAGTYLRSAVSAIRQWGVCREVLWPYLPVKVFSGPSVDAYTEAKKHLILNHYQLNNGIIDELKQCLALGFPFIFGMSIYSSFMSAEVSRTGIIPVPRRGENLMGGHAMACVGYDDSKEAFIIRNSWSVNWGQKGYCYIPYKYLTSRLASDFWTLRTE